MALSLRPDSSPMMRKGIGPIPMAKKAMYVKTEVTNHTDFSHVILKVIQNDINDITSVELMSNGLRPYFSINVEERNVTTTFITEMVKLIINACLGNN